MKLTAAEKKWVADMQKLLDACPGDRLGFYTIGDSQLTLYDKRLEKEINELMDSGKASDFPIAVDNLDAEVGRLKFPALVHSVAG